MSELVKQLVEEISEIVPKYSLIRVINRYGQCREIEKIYSSNNKKELKRRMFEIVIKQLLVEEYVKAEMFDDCDAVYIIKKSDKMVRQGQGHKNFVKLRKMNEEVEIIDIKNLDNTDKKVAIFPNKEYIYIPVEIPEIINGTTEDHIYRII